MFGIFGAIIINAKIGVSPVVLINIAHKSLILINIHIFTFQKC